MELKEFKITVLPLRAKLLNYARKLTDEPEDAEDAVQEVLLKLWNKRLELEQYRSIEAFAMTLTHNICIDMWRCKRNDTLSLDIVQAASPTGTPERLLEIKDEIHLMHEIIDSLPNLQRTIMRMKDIEGYETDEIAETSCEEERELRRFFTEEEVPEHLQTYRPLFAYLNREATSMAEPTEEKSVTTESAKEVPTQRKPSRLYRTFYAVSGIAAGLLLLLGVAKIIFPLSGVPENYVVIDGQRYTDEKLVEAKALEALQNASFTDEDLSNLLFQH